MEPQESDDDEWADEQEILEYAASRIQQCWRRRSRRKTVSTAASGICCACFVPLSDAEHQESMDTPAVSLFCRACRSKLAQSTTSPTLPTLSVLVQTEAKYQEQLRLLRQQQELLQRRQNEMELRKQSQAEAAEREKQLVRTRRRHFQMLMKQRALHEAERLQTMAQDTKDDADAPKPKRKVKRPMPPVAAPMDNNVVIASRPVPMRHTAQNTSQHESKAAELAERAAQVHRRKQKMLTASCYAQDLTPLIHGSKPKKLPAPPVQPASTYMKTKTQKSSKAGKMRLVPISKSSEPVSSNQRSISEEREMELRVKIPKHRTEGSMSSQPTPLTAEIRPIAWIYDLGKEVLGEDAVPASSIGSQSPMMGRSTSLQQLSTVYEQDHDEETREYDQHQRSHSFLSGVGQRVTLAPLASATPPPSHTEPAAKWEYSSDRLASLLAKYNISVASTT